ncbi:hypothetical protein Ae201684_002878 [Aphanomyces euteiches]|uniref:CREG-like beta-barrel domain-containing protein n=1 Tax=Aphanomyces euteiches TaxID=100861 RepID=A0A6G0XP71_9STRA|nr:hypothetical protein Ae201684_002878 [Aphanomyces euteiches]KAH9151153.1 hypothetical protein AeRB84_006168 [Aphanomyces euteiches]
MSATTPLLDTGAHSATPSRKWLFSTIALASCLAFLAVNFAPTWSTPATLNLRTAMTVESFSGLTPEESRLVHATDSNTQSARHARWIVHSNDWATIATSSIHLNGAPFANMASYSDGVGTSVENATGHLYFYLTPLDSTGKDVVKSPNVSVSITMAQLGNCKMDPQDPTCWKVVFSGPLLPVEDNDARQDALEALFSKHPQMASWPDDHGFEPFELHPTEILLLDFYGGPKLIAPSDYYAVHF